MVRRRRDGGYFSILTPPAGASRTVRVAFRSRFVHIAVGYPGLRLLPDLQAYREKYRDPTKVVNAYEPHEHVYRQLAVRPGKVMVRGGGVVACRVLQRLIDEQIQQLPQAYTYPYGLVSEESIPILREAGFRCTLCCMAGMNTITRDPGCLVLMKRLLRPHGTGVAELLQKYDK